MDVGLKALLMEGGEPTVTRFISHTIENGEFGVAIVGYVRIPVQGSPERLNVLTVRNKVGVVFPFANVL